MNYENDNNRPIKILHIEDSPLDAEIIRERLADGGYAISVDWASNEQEFTAFLKKEKYDLILADYNIPGFEAPASLLQMQTFYPDVPFICVSGAIGEEKAVELLKLGATDYISKDKLDRLNMAVKRALNEVSECNKLRLAEEALRESEFLFSQMFKQSITSTCFYNPEGTIVKVNQAFCKMFGVEENTILNAGYNIFKDQAIIDVGVVPILRDIFEEKKKKSWEINFDIDVASDSTGTSTSKTGKIFLEVFGYPVLNPKGDLEYVVLQHYDITSRKQAEKELEKAVEAALILKTAIMQIPIGVALSDKNLNLYFCNPAGLGMRGGDVKELTNIPKETYSNWQVLKLDGEPYEIKDLPLVRAINEKKVIREEFIVRHKDGSDHICDATAAPVLDNENTVIGGLIVFPEITERRRMEEDRERHLAAIEQLSEGVVITDTDGTIEYVNSALEKITGYPRQELIGQNPRILKSGEHDDAFYQQMWETITAGNTWNGKLVNKKKGGLLYIEEATISPVLNISGKIINFVAVKRDITDEIKMEERLAQSQKMESIGTLAGGIAHDFNNILFPVIGHTELLMDDFPDAGSTRESLNAIYSGALRARDLVQQILAFARQEKSELRLMKMQPIIKEAIKLIRSTIPTSISITQNLQPDCGPVTADPTQIHQIVMNLATNAYHAMEESGGELTVSLKEIELGEYDLMSPDMSPGLYARLTIGDTGVGMNKDVMNRIFDPYFTTKEKGKGTGMGLSVVHGIVKGMKGEIQVYSEPDKGTEFRIYLPIVKSASESQESKTDEAVLGGCERILLVDDEQVIITMERLVLERLGYHITSRTSSIEALEAFKADPDKFDLVITDMSMPKMPGDKLAAELIKIRPDIPILICTGFSETLTEERIKSIGIKGLLMKPMTIKDLAPMLRDALDKKDE